MKLFKLWLPVFAWCWVIYKLSSIPNLRTDLVEWDLILRKAAHLTEYFILAWLSFRACKNTFSFGFFYQLFVPGLFSVFYAITDEIHQAYVPTRGPSIGDVLIDSTGVIIFCLLVLFRKRLTRR